MMCRYCGLETGSGAGHRSQAECIQALSDEINRAKRLVNHAREAGNDDRVHVHATTATERRESEQ
jgi:hypothetical protein